MLPIKNFKPESHSYLENNIIEKRKVIIIEHVIITLMILKIEEGLTEYGCVQSCWIVMVIANIIISILKIDVNEMRYTKT